MKLLPHQQPLARGYPDRGLLAWETGTGKTIGAIAWLKDGRDSDALIICPKRVVQKWQETLALWDSKAVVLSKEQFKKTAIKKYSAIVVDEVDEFGSALFVPGKRSQLSAHLYDTLKDNKETPRLLLSATPVRSTPWNLHTLLCFMGYYVPYKKWRDKFFVLTKRPYLPRPTWLPKTGWQKGMQPLLKKYADIVLMRDCVGELPPETSEVIHISTPLFTSSEWEPAKAFVEEHKHEQTNKAKKIKEIGRGYRKVLVVAHYVEQVEDLRHDLAGERLTFAIHGGVKDQEAVIAEAQEADECYFIVQASLGAGFDADTFSCVVFASMSYRVRDWVQMRGRVRRIHNLHPVYYYYLHGGRLDKKVYETIRAGRDFIPAEFA